MWIIALIVNIFLPGVGSLVILRIFQGLAQIVIAVIGGILSALGPGIIFGAPLSFIAWVWAIVTAIQARPRADFRRPEEL